MNVSRNASFLGLAALAALGWGGRPALADTFVTIDYPNVASTRVISVNDNGDMVGVYRDAADNTRGFERRADGTFSGAIVDPNNNSSPNNDGSTLYTRALGINNSGTVVGDYLNQTGNLTAYHGYLLNGTTFTTFDVGGPFSTGIAGINNAGDFAGSFGSDAQTNQAFLNVGGVLTEFNGPAGNTNTQAVGINSSHEVVGTYTDSAGTQHGFSRDPASGAITTIDPPGSVLTSANGINDAGVIVGFYYDSNSYTHGFFDKGGVFTTFDAPGSQYTTIRGINNEGVIVGGYSDSSGVVHGYRDTPPTTHLLWRNGDGRALLWTVQADGTFRIPASYGPYTDGSASTPWAVTAVATGPDGLSHLLWTNPDGRAALWTVKGDGTFTPTFYGPYTDSGQLWKAVAVSVGGDNVPHLLWTNPDGKALLWNVHPDGTFTIPAVYGPYTDGSPNTPWAAAAVATSADGISHLLWDNLDGRAALWTVAADGTFTPTFYGPYTDGLGWSAKAVSVGGDGVPHLLWDNGDGRSLLWTVNADGTFTIPAVYGPYTDGSPNTPWAAAAVATSADGISHLLWDNLDGRAALWTVAADGTFTPTFYGPYTDGKGWTAVAVSAGP